MDFKLNIETLVETIKEYEKILKVLEEEKEAINNILRELYNGWSGEAKDKFEEVHNEKQKLYNELEENIKYIKNVLENEEKPRAIKLKNRCENYVHLVSRRGCAAETTPDDKGVITMNLSGINAVENIIDNCTDNYNISIRNKLYEIDDILDEFEFTSFGIGGEINESQRSIKEQNNNLNDFRESVSIYNKEVIEMENNTAGKLKRIAGTGEGKEGAESQIGDNTSIEFIPTFSSSVQYIPGQIVKIKGLDGKWYIGTAQVDELVGTGGYRKFKFVPNKLNDVDVSEKENVIEYLKSRGNGIIAGIEHYSTGCRNALDYIGENWLGLDYDRPCIDNPNVTIIDQINKAKDDDAREYNRLRNNSQYKSVFDNTSKNVEKTLNTIDMVLAIHGIKNIAVGSANYLRANKPYIQANVETVKNNANILNEAISNVNKRPRSMVLGADGGNIDSYIRDVNKEYKNLKNVESVVNKSGTATNDSLYARSSFRKSARAKAEAEAPRDSAGNMICPTCGEVISPKITVQTKNGSKTRVGYDLDHYPITWEKRKEKMKSSGIVYTRKQVLDEYNSDLRVQCPPCNQSHEFEGVEGEFANGKK